MNEPPFGKAKPAWPYSVITDALKSLLFSAWGQHTFQKTMKPISTGDTYPPIGIQKMLVSLPSLEEPKSFKGLNQEKGVGDYTCAGHFTRIMSLNLNSITSVLHEENEACPWSDGSQQWCQELNPHLVGLSPNSAAQSVSHRDRRHAPKKKARVLRMNRKQWKTNQCTRLGNGHFLQRFLLLFFSPCRIIECCA